MKLLVLTDLEGVGGIVRSDQTKIKTLATEENYAYYQEARRLQIGEVNAAVQGALDGGATEIVVWDGHSAGFNFLVEELHPGAEYVIGGGYRGSGSRWMRATRPLPSWDSMPWLARPMRCSNTRRATTSTSTP